MNTLLQLNVVKRNDVELLEKNVFTSVGFFGKARQNNVTYRSRPRGSPCPEVGRAGVPRIPRLNPMAVGTLLDRFKETWCHCVTGSFGRQHHSTQSDRN